MNTKLKVILTAMSIAVLASPVMAETDSNRSAAEISHAHASAHVRHQAYARAHINESRMLAVPGNQPAVEDCVHVTFPQCGGDADQATR